MKSLTFHLFLFVLGLSLIFSLAPFAQVQGRYIGNAVNQEMYTAGTWGAGWPVGATKTVQLTSSYARVFGMTIYAPNTESRIAIGDQVFSGTDTLPSEKTTVSGAAAASAVSLSATPVFFSVGSTTNVYQFIEFPRPLDIRNGLVLSVTSAYVDIYYCDDKNEQSYR